MKSRTRSLAATRWASAAGVLLWLALPVAAEVGVTYSEPSGSAGGPYIFAIIEDPDPIGSRSWRRISPEDSDRVVLNPDGELNGDGTPSTVLNRFSGLPIVAWATSTPSGFDVVVSHFTAGAWSEPAVVAETADDELDPFLAVDPTDGTVHLLYWIGGGSPRVMHVQAPADLASWSLPVEVSQPGEIAARPAATFHQGQLRVVYEAHGTVPEDTPRLIVLATKTASGFASEVLATTLHAGPNWPRVHSRAGRIWVEWIDNPITMSFTERGPGEVWQPLGLEVFVSSEDREYFVRGRIRGQVLD